jgi:hypothetical protein
MPIGGPILERRQTRERWFASVQSTLHGTDLVFVDPDNGLEPEGYSHGSAKSGKSILLSEIQQLATPGRCMIVYHHHTRRKGGHHSEIEHWRGRLREIGFQTVDALRAKPYSPRVFFLLDASPEIRRRAAQIALHWKGLITWHPEKRVDAELTENCCATIKVRIPDNQDEKVVAGLVPQGGRSPTGGANPATTDDKALSRASIVT